MIEFKNVTDGSKDGKGVFDVAMRSLNNHIKSAMDNQLIKQSDAGAIYTQLIPTIFQTTVQFELEKDIKQAQVVGLK